MPQPLLPASSAGLTTRPHEHEAAQNTTTQDGALCTALELASALAVVDNEPS